MGWVLIIFLLGSYTNNIQVVEFTSEQSCLIASHKVNQVKAKKIYTVCVKK